MYGNTKVCSTSYGSDEILVSGSVSVAASPSSCPSPPPPSSSFLLLHLLLFILLPLLFHLLFLLLLLLLLRTNQDFKVEVVPVVPPSPADLCYTLSYSPCPLSSALLAQALASSALSPRWPGGKASASRAAEPGSNPAFPVGLFQLESHRWLKGRHGSEKKGNFESGQKKSMV